MMGWQEEILSSITVLVIIPLLDKSAVPRECQQFAEVAVGKGEGGRGRAVGGRAAAVGKA